MPSDSTRSARLAVVALGAASALVSTAFVLVLVLRLDALFFTLAEPLFSAPHPPHAMSDDTRMAQCILWGLFGGWGVAMAWAFARVPTVAVRELSRATMGGLVVWYVLDSGGCLLSNAPGNAAFNTVYMIAITIPLIRLMRRET